MDFLESSAVLVPALTGMALTLYNGDRNTLKWFEHEYCFSPQLQKNYTAHGLEMFFQAGTEKLIYHLEESMGTHLITFKNCGQWDTVGGISFLGVGGQKLRVGFFRNLRQCGRSQPPL